MVDGIGGPPQQVHRGDRPFRLAMAKSLFSGSWAAMPT
jgi:hypothetical protein